MAAFRNRLRLWTAIENRALTLQMRFQNFKRGNKVRRNLLEYWQQGYEDKEKIEKATVKDRGQPKS
jgi:hypothetical protein